MRLKRIEIHGFKSLAKKTELTFPGMITCIAGPNGCGKSNIADAIRWVLGEQSPKSLRAAAMEDVIFFGTQEISPSGMASVNLEFIRDGGYFPKSLDGFNEISISRKLYRTGESLYTINGLKCRLKDIMDIFLDTGLGRNGYAIIEQGKIEDIVQASPQDIRILIEEAAGISKFRMKKQEAIKRLEKTTYNLERIRDLLGEISKQRDTLKSHARKAKRYQALRKEANEFTRLLWSHEGSEIKKQMDGFVRDEAGINARIMTKEDKIGTAAGRLERLRSEAEEKKQEIERLSNALRQAKSTLEIAQRDIVAWQTRLKDLQSTRDMLNSRLDHSRRYITDIKKQISEAEAALSMIEDKISYLEKGIDKVQHSLRGLKSKHDEISKSYEQERTKLFDLIGHTRAIDQRIVSIKQRGGEINSNIKARRKELEDATTKRLSLKKEAGLIEDEIVHLEESMGDTSESQCKLNKEEEELKALVGQESNELFKIEQEYSAINDKIAFLEGIIHPTPPVNGNKASTGNSLKKVSDIIRVKAGFEEAVGRSLGDFMDYVIITDYTQALNAIDKDIYPGFIPIHPYIGADKSPGIPKGKGVLGQLRSFIEVHKNFSDVADVLTDGMLVVEDIDAALDVWHKKEYLSNMVTKDGMVLEKTGVIRTATNNTKYVEVLKAKTEKEALVKDKDTLLLKIKDIKVGIEDKETKMTGLRSRIQALQEEITQKDTKLNILRNKIVDLHGQIDRKNDKIAAFDKDIDMWSGLKEQLDRDLIDARGRKDDIDCKIEGRQGRVKDLEKAKEDVMLLIDENNNDLQEDMAAIQELKISSASKNERLNKLSEQLRKEDAAIKDDEERLIDIDKNEDKIEEAISIRNATIEKTHIEIKKLEGRYNSILSEHNKILEEVATLDSTISSLEKELSVLERKLDEIVLKHSQQEIAFNMVLKRIKARFGGDISPVPDEFDPDSAERKIVSLQARIERMGQINFTSIEGYEEIQSRWEDLNKQYQDLMLSSARLKQVISDAQRQSAKEFKSTFTNVKENFSKVFTELFSGGKADLIIQDGDPLEGGIEIMACPPHKRLKRMTLLSGGEKSLCAISLIFALFKTKPSTFCILDEADASLDDINIERFKRLVKRFSNESQFIIVTHSKQTMTMADVIYGITFETPGVSKMVSMDLQYEQ